MSYSNFKESLKEALELAKHEDILGAMMMNSLVQCSALGYSFEPVLFAMEEGASCAGITGKGPAIAALCSTNRIADQIEKRWKQFEGNATLIRTRVVQPREIL